MLFVELARHNDADCLTQDRELERRMAQRFAIDLDTHLGRRFDANAAAALLQDVTDAVDAAVEQVVEPEKQVPEVHRTNQRQVEHAIVGNRLGQLLDAAAVELADAHGGRQQQVVVDQPSVHPHLHTRRLVAEEVPDQAPRIAPTALVPLLLEVRKPLDHVRVETGAGHVGHVAALTVVRLLVGDYPDVLQEGEPLGNGPHGMLVAVRHAERPDPVVARTDSNDGQQHLLGTNLLLDEQAVHHLVQRTVASDDDDVAVALAHGRHGKLRSVELMLREDRLAEDMGIAQVLGYLRKVIEPAAASGRRIDDHEPLRPLLLRATFQGHCAACEPGNRRTWPPRRSRPFRRANAGS